LTKTALVLWQDFRSIQNHRITKEEKPEFKETGTKFGPSLDWIKPMAPLSTDWPISLSFSRFKHWKQG
jgi:outer membrane protein assembly factor BamA